MRVVIGTTCNMHVVVFLGWQAVSSVFPAQVVRRIHQYGPGTSQADSRFYLFSYVSGGGMNRVCYDICMYHLWFVCASPGVFLIYRVTGACPVTTDLIMRVNIRTTTTFTFSKRISIICIYFSPPRGSCTRRLHVPLDGFKERNDVRSTQIQ